MSDHAPTVRIVDFTRWVRWDVLLAPASAAANARVNPYQLYEEVCRCFDNVQAAFPGVSFKLGHALLTPGTSFAALLDRLRDGAGPAPYRTMLEDPVGDLLEALDDAEADALWLYGGGDPNNFAASEGEMTGLFAELIPRLWEGAPRRATPKRVLGFCAMTPLLMYLHAHGFARAIHGPLVVDFSLGMAEVSVEPTRTVVRRMREHLLSPGPSVTFRGVQLGGPSPAVEGTRLADGVVLGGVLHGVAAFFERLASVPAPPDFGRPLVLLLELIDLGDEPELVALVTRAITEERLTLAALLLGYARPRFDKTPAERAAYHDVVHRAFDALAAACAARGVPVLANLPVGHHYPNFPLPFGRATLTLGAAGRALDVRYSA